MIAFKSRVWMLLLLIGYFLNAQEWSSRITIAEAHLINTSFMEKEEDKNTTKIGLVKADGDLFILQNGNFSTGFNMLFEGFLDDGFLVKDMFVYNIGTTYEIGAFSISFMIENFLNLNQNEYEMLPEPEIVNDTVHHTNYFLDSPFSVAFGIVFNF